MTQLKSWADLRRSDVRANAQALRVLVADLRQKTAAILLAQVRPDGLEAVGKSRPAEEELALKAPIHFDVFRM
jgi:hypothetical protein